jgi:two-component system, chemotaxis family, sensor kinase CheA
VLDVSDGTLLDADAAEGMELAMVKDRVTMVHRESGMNVGTSAAAWQEVA